MHPQMFLVPILSSLLLSCRKDEVPQPAARIVANASRAGTPAGSAVPGRSSGDSCSVDPVRCGGRIPESVFRYHEDFSQILQASGPADLPALWEKEVRARNDLEEVLEDLPDSLYARAGSLMDWHVLNRDEVVFVAPVLDSFRALARRRGTAIDMAFFGYRADPAGTGAPPGWLRQLTDVTACEDWGSPDFFQALRRLAAVRPGLPPVYRSDLHDPADDLRSALRSGICACDARTPTLANFQKHLEGFPEGLPERALLDSAGRAMRQPRPTDRYECSPG